ATSTPSATEATRRRPTVSAPGETDGPSHRMTTKALAQSRTVTTIAAATRRSGPDARASRSRESPAPGRAAGARVVMGGDARAGHRHRRADIGTRSRTAAQRAMVGPMGEGHDGGTDGTEV